MVHLSNVKFKYAKPVTTATQSARRWETLSKKMQCAYQFGMRFGFFLNKLILAAVLMGRQWQPGHKTGTTENEVA